MPPRAGAVGVEVAFSVATGRSAAAIAAEVAYGTAHAAAAFLAVEVACVPAVMPAGTSKRSTTQVALWLPW